MENLRKQKQKTNKTNKKQTSKTNKNGIKHNKQTIIQTKNEPKKQTE